MYDKTLTGVPNDDKISRVQQSEEINQQKKSADDDDTQSEDLGLDTMEMMQEKEAQGGNREPKQGMIVKRRDEIQMEEREPSAGHTASGAGDSSQSENRTGNAASF